MTLDRRGEDGGVDFGVYCVPEGDGTLAVGETLSGVPQK